MKRKRSEPLDVEAILRARLEDTPANRRQAAGTAKGINTVRRKKLEKKMPLLLATGAVTVTETTPDEVWAKRQAATQNGLANLGEHERRNREEIERVKSEVRVLTTEEEFNQMLDREEGWNGPAWADWYAMRSRQQRRRERFPFDLGFSQRILDALETWPGEPPTHFEMLDMLRAVDNIEFAPETALEILRELQDRGYVHITKGRACTVSGRSICPTWRFLTHAQLLPPLVQLRRAHNAQ